MHQLTSSIFQKSNNRYGKINVRMKQIRDVDDLKRILFVWSSYPG